MTPEWIGAAWFTAAGLLVGSFLNVCIHRLPRRESVVRPSSRCPHCGRFLRWYDNVPLLSYVLLRGRCRFCRQPIAARYPAVEAATAAMFLLHLWAFGWQPLLAPRLAFACAMVLLFAIDLGHRLLPNAITLPGIAAGLAFSVIFPPGWRASLAGAALGGAILLGIAEAYFRLRGEEGLGMGDVKMLAMIGAFLGWKAVLVTLVLASLSGSAFGMALIASGRGTRKYALPFGTFLAAGAIVAGLVGDGLVDWYLGFY